MPSFTTSTITFLFTDIEGSTKLWEEHGDAMHTALARHDALVRQAIESNHGFVFKTVGDAFHAAFQIAPDAIAAALAAQRALNEGRWDKTPIRARMALLTGVAEERDGDYFGPPLNWIARLLASGHGGQVLLSQATYELVRRDRLPEGVTLRDLGEHQLKDLIHPGHIYQIVAADLPSEFPPLKTLDTPPNNLPIQLTSFIGREKEIAEIKRLLAATRLLTLTGAGGAGKTRLSLQVAADLLDGFKNGAWFIELAPLSDLNLVPQTIAAALGLQNQSARPMLDALNDYLKEKTLLLVLDNCEHLIQACAELADALLHYSPRFKILATSREALSVAGETIFRVPSLSLPDANKLPPLDVLSQYESVRLFTDRAFSAQPNFVLTGENASAVAEVCQRLDGIPLAIELAAARIKALKPEEIAARLDNSFRLLTGGSRTAPTRQQTLRGTINWSYDLLSEPEGAMLRQLSVFTGGWMLEAAEAVCADISDVLDVLSRLIDKSLVIVETREGATRYRMLETIRQYAREKLLESGESEKIQNRHLEYFVNLAEVAEPKLRGAEQVTWFNRLETELDNFRGALDWSIGPEKTQLGLQLAGALGYFWVRRTFWSEGYERLVRVLKENEEKTLARANALRVAAELATRSGNSVEMYPLIEESIQILRVFGVEGMRLLGYTLARYSWAIYDRDPVQARSIAEEGIQISRKAGDLLGLAECLSSLGQVTRRLSDFTSSRSALKESAALFQKMGDRHMYAQILNNLSMVDYFEGNLSQAKEYIEQAISIHQEMGDKFGQATSRPALGDIARRQGNYEEASSLLRKNVEILREMGQAHQLLILSLYYLGMLELTRGKLSESNARLKEGIVGARKADLRYYLPSLIDALGYLATVAKFPERAARLFGAAELLREQLQTPMPPVYRDDYEKYLPLARAQLDDTAFNAAWAEGRAMTFDQAIDFAFADIRIPDTPDVSSLSPRQAAKEKFDGLTAREREVAELIAQGKSNREIAKMLVVSERTIEGHVSNILAKLEFTARTQIVAWAVQKGLRKS